MLLQLLVNIALPLPDLLVEAHLLGLIPATLVEASFVLMINVLNKGLEGAGGLKGLYAPRCVPTAYLLFTLDPSLPLPTQCDGL